METYPYPIIGNTTEGGSGGQATGWQIQDNVAGVTVYVICGKVT
ncbi:hypothetical protein [Humibacter sp.]|nr:hypothetical protein [Humibacter sp.]HVX08371.1 hypothetical protein [Humibacter sp.]